MNRKWCNSNIPITSIQGMIDSLSLYGGVWWSIELKGGTCGRFINKAWVISQQLNFLNNQIKLRGFYYPKLNKKGDPK